MNRSYITAGSLVLVAGLWMLSGLLGDDESGSTADAESTFEVPGIIVEAEVMEAEPITSYIIAQGNIEPNRTVILRAETEGQVEEILVREGGRVETGDAIARLELDDREIRREQAELRIEERKRNLEATRSLHERGFATQSELDAAEVELKMAEVELAQINLEIGKTVIRAPFDGIIDESQIEVGDYVSLGNEVLTLVDINPLVVTVQVPQHSVGFLEEGARVDVTLVNDERVEGFVRYIASRADEGTRTYRVEVEIPNPEGLRAGSSATAHIPKENIQGHFISGALLTLNEAGDMGVKTVDRSGLVSFHPVTIEFSESGGMWVSGLPETARVITSGQGFAKIGERVTVAESPPSREGFSGSGYSEAESVRHAKVG